ncbi:uncharacterized protein BKCO1_80006 [Diplodia corticola]|uniref:Uncharacterized protein n=1 Tax=Diplodia corticola TaxID=236234 RepID=A0A1J9RWZ6_9PEZI|nr:uncharacterized protein BKCO1_80006 [Diplodia corticola]OJD37163.1 hypothetical protein BKCO1_80006 [Diplodia corticola]
MAEKEHESHSNGTIRFEAPDAASTLEGTGVLVTGGATGVGAAMVTALANAGAYVTIADSVANEGQRLMLDLVNQNKHVQYLHTPLSSFRSQTETFAHASAFSPTGALSLVIINTLPPDSSPSFAPADSLFDWLANPPSVPGFPPTLGPPPTAPLDLSVTAVLYSVHLAFHHFKAAAAAADGAGAKAGREEGGSSASARVNAERHILFLAPRAYVDEGGLGPGVLASGAAAAGLRAVFKDLRGVVQRGVPGLDGSGVRVNLVAVGETVKSDGINGGGAKVEGRMSAAKKVKVDGVLLEEEDEEKYVACVDAVMRVVYDGNLQGCALAVSNESVQGVNI